MVTPNPAGARASGLAAVACSAAGACTAAGQVQRGTRVLPLAERWNGTAFSIQPTASPAGQAKPGGSGGRPGKATSADEVQPQFREALERKRAREAGNAGAPGHQDAGKIHGAHGPARNRRSFRRKSG